MKDDCTQNETEEGDDFWQVALMPRDNEDMLPDWKLYGVDEDDDDVVAKPFRYILPTRNLQSQSAKIDLVLYPLPAMDGVWSPVGADAWYASALLSSLLMLQVQDDTPKPQITERKLSQNPLSSILLKWSNHPRQRPIVLELGSGAVGLSGLVCAHALQEEHYRVAAPKDDLVPNISWKVIMTDNDTEVLDQLRKNVDCHRGLFQRDIVSLHVEYLDWGNEKGQECILDTEQEEVSLVIGSELVYTRETAQACLRLLLELLERYPRVHIWIVQVTDRFGWQEIVLPALEATGTTAVDQMPLPSDIHDKARTMIPIGGTLDRHAYGNYWIRNKGIS